MQKIKFEDRNNDWEIWKKNSSIERSIKRVKKHNETKIKVKK